MKLFIAQATCSLAVQIVLNELGNKTTEIIHYDVFGKSTSNGDNFAEVNPRGYVPVLQLPDHDNYQMAETAVITSYLADRYPESRLAPAQAGRAAELHRYRNRPEAHPADAQATDRRRRRMDPRQAGGRLHSPGRHAG
jgi:glutathione S-transferase